MNTDIHHGRTLLAATGIALMLTAFGVYRDTSFTALVLGPSTEETGPKWKVIEAAQMASGATVPANTNVVFHVTQRTSRTILFGPKSGKLIRYWGYCFPENEMNTTPKAGTLPGKVFLSEAEREWREKRVQPTTFYSIYQPPTRSEMRKPRVIEPIRHQLEMFLGVCYVMTSRPLPIGLDLDGDGLNAQVEKNERTDPRLPDTDGDGVSDGDELSIGTNPLLRDTDSDGVIDGIENANRNGRQEGDETDGTKRDTDGDSICDGYCRVTGDVKMCKDLKGQDCFDLPYARWTGEDKNLNGKVDKDETDPRKADTDDDNLPDGQEYYNCLLAGDDDC